MKALHGFLANSGQYFELVLAIPHNSDNEGGPWKRFIRTFSGLRTSCTERQPYSLPMGPYHLLNIPRGLERNLWGRMIVNLASK